MSSDQPAYKIVHEKKHPFVGKSFANDHVVFEVESVICGHAYGWEVQGTEKVYTWHLLKDLEKRSLWKPGVSYD